MNRLVFLIGFLTLICVVACNGGGSVNEGEEPGKVAVQVFEAITSGDTKILKENLYISNRQQRETFFSYLDMAVSSDKYKNNVKGYEPSYNIANEKVYGDSAEVILTGVNLMGENVRITVKMLKKDGKWKVDGDHGVWHGR